MDCKNCGYTHSKTDLCDHCRSEMDGNDHEVQYIKNNYALKQENKELSIKIENLTKLIEYYDDNCSFYDEEKAEQDLKEIKDSE